MTEPPEGDNTIQHWDFNPSRLTTRATIVQLRDALHETIQQRDAALAELAVAHSLAQHAVDAENAARDALIRIKNEQGQVCENFTECNHRACMSSYTAWAIADEVLNPITEKEKTL